MKEIEKAKIQSCFTEYLFLKLMFSQTRPYSTQIFELKTSTPFKMNTQALILIASIQIIYVLSSPPPTDTHPQLLGTSNFRVSPVQKEWNFSFGKSQVHVSTQWTGYREVAHGSTYLLLGAAFAIPTTELSNMSSLMTHLKGSGQKVLLPSTRLLLALMRHQSRQRTSTALCYLCCSMEDMGWNEW